MSSTGWPGVLAAFGGWVGQSYRGLVMGVWQSNAFVGNIIGRQLAGDFLDYGWGSSFMYLALILGIIGIIENDEDFLSCSDEEEEVCSSWIDQMNNITKSEARKKLGNMKTIWGFAYAFFMFLR